MAEKHHKVIIIGSGPAGYTAAIYTSRALLKPLMFSGLESGGQLMNTTDVENFPGFPQGIMGPELMSQFQKQAERFGTQMVPKNVTEVDFSKRPFEVGIDGEQFTSDSIIIATGASPKMLGIENEWSLMGKGVSTCATCDGAFYRNKEVAVVGGGDSAMEEALFLTRFASKVHVIHRRDSLRASQIMQDRAFENEKINFMWNHQVSEIFSDASGVTGLQLENTQTHEKSDLKIHGLFIAIGHTPNTKIFEGQIELDEKKYIQKGFQTLTQTSVGGVFCCGDAQDQVYRQAITAAGSGCQAAIDCERYLESLGE